MAEKIDVNDFQDFEEAADHLKQVDFAAWQLYNKVSTATGLEAYEGFKAAAEEAAEKIRAKTGPLYTEEGKRAQIREDIEQLADTYQSKAEKAVQKQAAALEELKSRLAADIVRGSRIKKPEESEQLQAETRTALAFAQTARGVEKVLRELIERGKQDKTAAQFAVTYGYLFADRAGELTADGTDRAISLNHINALLSEAKSRAYSDTLRAKQTIQQAVEWKQFFHSPSTRLIKMHRDNLIKKYQ